MIQPAYSPPAICQYKGPTICDLWLSLALFFNLVFHCAEAMCGAPATRSHSSVTRLRK